jgi:hypothetical protein
MRLVLLIALITPFPFKTMDQSVPSFSSLLQSTPPDELCLQSICLASSQILVAKEKIKIWDDYPYGIPTKKNEDRSPGRGASPSKRTSEPVEVLASHWFHAKYSIASDGGINPDDPLDSSSPVSVESLLSRSNSSSRTFSFDSDIK